MVDPMDRRTFLVAAAAGGAALLTPRARAGQSDTGLARGGAFRQSVASGQPTPGAVTLWTRIEDVDRAARMQVEVSPDADFRRTIYRRTITAHAEEDFTVSHRVAAEAFAPGERYFYRFHTCEQDSPVGRFRLPPPPDSNEPIRIAFFSCQRWERGYFTPHAGLAAEPDLDLAICLGDYVYEEATTRNTNGRVDTTGANRDAEVQTLAEYRDKYRLYHSDPDLLAVRATVPLMSIWDDHEAENNYAGDEPSNNDGEENVTMPRRVPFPERRANAYRAFFEHMPRVRDPAEADRIYGSLRLGGNAELMLLDTRQYRDQPPCGGEAGSRCPDAERFAPGRTLLGAEQLAWLKRGLTGSSAAWKLVGNQVMIMGLDLPRGNAVNPDQWDGYAAERQDLLRTVQAAGTQDIAFLTGDIHTFFAGNVTPTGRQDPVAGPVAAATEFVSGSITSGGFLDDTGIREESGSTPLNVALEANNPHLRFVNGNLKGYGVLTATREELRVDYRAVRSVEQPRSEAFTLAAFRVRRGAAEVETLDLPA